MHEERVRFQHCDPAGIVFYPRYFEMANACIEAFLDARGVSFAEIHGPRGLALPTAEVTATFRAPSRLGDALALALRVTRLGRTSVGLALDVSCEGAPRVAIAATLVCVAMADGRPRPWPDDLRGMFELEARDA